MTDGVERLEEYARLATHVGINPQAGQRPLLVSVPVELAPFARLLAKHAYLAGARFVEVEWVDDQQDRLRLQYGSPESLHESADWRAELNIEYLREGDATLNVVGGNPDVLAGLDPAAGDNHSLVRVDFMIGFAEMDVDGLTQVRTAEPFMRSGEWAFEL